MKRFLMIAFSFLAALVNAIYLFPKRGAGFTCDSTTL